MWNQFAMEVSDGIKEIKNTYSINRVSLSFSLLIRHEHRFLVLFRSFPGIDGSAVSVLYESKDESHFWVTMCDNEFMKPNSLLLIIVNDPVYLCFVMMSLSSVQLMILI